MEYINSFVGKYFPHSIIKLAFTDIFQSQAIASKCTRAISCGAPGRLPCVGGRDWRHRPEDMQKYRLNVQNSHDLYQSIHLKIKSALPPWRIPVTPLPTLPLDNCTLQQLLDDGTRLSIRAESATVILADGKLSFLSEVLSATVVEARPCVRN